MSKKNHNHSKKAESQKVEAIKNETPETTESTPDMNLAQIAARRAELENMERNLRQQEIDKRNAERAKYEALPAQVGLPDVAALIEALRGLSRKGRRLSTETRGQIRDALMTGQTGRSVAEMYGVSLPTVQLIKQEAGLVRSRAKNETTV